MGGKKDASARTADEERLLAEFSALKTLDTPTRRLEALCTAAQIVLESGAETYRVEETVVRMAKGLGVSDINVVAFPTSIFVEAQGHACVRRVSRRGTDMHRLVLINDVSRRAASGKMTLEQLERALFVIARARGRKPLVLVAACALACGSFSLSYGGGAGAFAVAFAIGALVQAIQPLFSGMEMGRLFSNFLGGMLSAVLARVASMLFPYANVNAAIIGAIMPLLSGLLMTTAVRDTMYGDLLSGIARATEALLLAASTALGVYVGLECMLLMGGAPL